MAMTDAETIADLQKRLAALEAPPPSSFSTAISNALTSLGKPDSVVMSLIRTALVAGGATLVNHGVATSSSVTDLVGTLMAVVAVLWSIFSKYAATHLMQVAIQAPSTTTLPELTTIAAAVPAGNVTAQTVATAVQQTQPAGIGAGSGAA